jgi:hypothetical protein
MKRSYVALKNEFDNGQSIKKSAAIHLIAHTDNLQKRHYHRWLYMVHNIKLY